MHVVLRPLMKLMKKIFIALFCAALVYACGSEETIEGDALFKQGKYKEAIEAFNTYLATNPSSASALYNRGRSYEELKQLDKAKADFEALLKLDPKNINAFLSLAKTAYNEKAYNKVLVYASSALKLNENSYKAHFFSARAAHQLGYSDQALESYNNSIRINKDYGEAYLYRGALKVGMEKPRGACEDFRFAQSLKVKGAEKALKDYCK